MGKLENGLDLRTVKHVADLARLDISDAEAAFFQKHLAKILDYIAQLESMPDSLPASWRGDVTRPEALERRDVIEPSLSPEDALATAPKAAAGAFVVPKIIE